MPKDFNDRVEDLVDRIEYLKKGEGGATEAFIAEGAPWSPENERVVRARMALTHLAEEVRYRANDWDQLTLEQKKAVLRAADIIEKAA